MTALIQYLMTMGMPPDQAAVFAAKLVGPQMRTELDIGPAEVTPYRPPVEIGSAEVRPTPEATERKVGAATYNRGPIAAGRTMHALGFNENDAAKVANQQGYQSSVMRELPAFLIQRYGFTPEMADMYARKMVQGGPDSEESSTPLKPTPDSLGRSLRADGTEQPWYGYWSQPQDPLSNNIQRGADAEAMFRRQPTWSGK